MGVVASSAAMAAGKAAELIQARAGGFKGVEGVESFTVSLMTERAVLIHDLSKLSAEQAAEMYDPRLRMDGATRADVHTYTESKTAVSARKSFRAMTRLRRRRA